MGTQSFSIRAQPLLPGFLPLVPGRFSTSALILVVGPASCLPGGDACWWRPCVCRLLPLILFLLEEPSASGSHALGTELGSLATELGNLATEAGLRARGRT